MRWKKLGQIYQPEPVHPKLLSHASNPLAIHLRDDLYRVFFDGRDSQNRSSVGFVDVDVSTCEVTYIHREPVFEHGIEGSFYSHGVSIGNYYDVGEERYILFMGWQHPPEGHWRGDIGRLRLKDNFSMVIDNSSPFIGPSEIDPISLSYPWVLHRRDQYLMWYGSTVTWDAGNGEMLHVINYASSLNGHTWNRHGRALPYELGVVQVFSRPTVVTDQSGYHMWFSFRSGVSGQKYKIGYAHSALGENWEIRLHDVGIDVSEAGWDSEMIEYPFVFDHRGRRLMFYNGNNYGKSGFGLAALERE